MKPWLIITLVVIGLGLSGSIGYLLRPQGPECPEPSIVYREKIVKVKEKTHENVVKVSSMSIPELDSVWAAYESRYGSNTTLSISNDDDLSSAP